MRRSEAHSRFYPPPVGSWVSFLPLSGKDPSMNRKRRVPDIGDVNLPGDMIIKMFHKGLDIEAVVLYVVMLAFRDDGFCDASVEEISEFIDSFEGKEWGEEVIRHDVQG